MKHLINREDYIKEYLHISNYIENVEKVYNNENELLGTFNNLDEYEFVPAQNANFPDVMPKGYIETEFGIIYPLTHRAFYMIEGNEYVYYHIVGEKDFYDLVN